MNSAQSKRRHIQIAFFSSIWVLIDFCVYFFCCNRSAVFFFFLVCACVCSQLCSRQQKYNDFKALVQLNNNNAQQQQLWRLPVERSLTTSERKQAKSGQCAGAYNGRACACMCTFWLAAVTVRWTPKSGYTIGAIEAFNYFDVTPLNPPGQLEHQVMHWELS